MIELLRETVHLLALALAVLLLGGAIGAVAAWLIGWAVSLMGDDR